jgi:hypothetical protein
MSNFQIYAGLPGMWSKIFKVAIIRKETGKIGWFEYVPAAYPEQAKLRAETALQALINEAEREGDSFLKQFYQKYCIVVTDVSFSPRFDGGENPQKWERWGMPKGVVPDQYVAACSGGGINLHIFGLGGYPECWECSNQQACEKESVLAGEQAEL